MFQGVLSPPLLSVKGVHVINTPSNRILVFCRLASSLLLLTVERKTYTTLTHFSHVSMPLQFLEFSLALHAALLGITGPSYLTFVITVVHVALPWYISLLWTETSNLSLPHLSCPSLSYPLCLLLLEDTVPLSLPRLHFLTLQRHTEVYLLCSKICPCVTVSKYDAWAGKFPEECAGNQAYSTAPCGHASPQAAGSRVG